MANILLIDDDADLRQFLCTELESLGHTVPNLDRAEQGPDLLARDPFDLVLLDNKMPGMSGIEFLEALRTRGITVPVILMTSYSTSDTAIQATNLGAFDYVIKPDTYQKLVSKLVPLIQGVLGMRVEEVQIAPGAPLGSATGPALVGAKSQAMVEVCKLIGRFARSGDAVLIRGETGTGKELVARAIHTTSPRKNKPFVTLNCTALGESLLDDELFGHEKGAFTNAEKMRKGKIEHADGGTLFLDEIGDMPMHLQVKLLRVLEYQEVCRIGSNDPIKVDVRLLSATHRDLETAIETNQFRRDLFYRLNRVTLRLPPLRERLEDFPDLVGFFLVRGAERAGRPKPNISPEAIKILREHYWPGNVRELENIIVSAVSMCPGSLVMPEHLRFPAEPSAHGTTNLPDPKSDRVLDTEAAAIAELQKAIEWAWASDQPKLWPLLHDILERELLKIAHLRLNGNQSAIAKRLGMARGTVIERMQKYGLKVAKEE